VYDAGCGPYGNGNGRFNATNWAAVNTTNPTSPCYNPCNSWRYNPWYGIVTYIPCGNNIYSPYGYRYWAPGNVMRAYYVPPPPSQTIHNGGFNGNSFPGAGATSGGYSGTMTSSATSSVSSAPAAAASTGTTSGASAATSSAGHGAAGGHGK
jgi:hypothetical protein